MGEEGEAFAGAGVEVFLDLGEGVIGKVIGQEGQEGTAQEGKIGQEVWFAGPGAVFPEEGVAAPVVADFDPAPVTADQAEPLRRGVLVGRSAGEIEARLGGREAGLFDGAVAAHAGNGGDRP